MKRLRHPIRAIREPFGTAGLIVAIVALVAAVGGTAFAAAGLTGKQKNEVKKIAQTEAKKLVGNGPAGPKGDPGAIGTNGTNGSPGAPGTPAEGTPFTGSKTVGTVTCTEGGVEIKSAKPATAVCNGKKGDPAEFPKTLPSGKTETGNWSAVADYAEGSELPVAAISYSIPLAQPSEKVVIVNEGEEEKEGCELESGSLEATPVAPAGTLCVFIRSAGQGTLKFVGENAINKGDSPSGAFFWIAASNSNEVVMSGTWAVTAK